MPTVVEPRTGVLAPVLGEPLPDPYVYRDGGEWYVFGTGEYFYHGSELSPEAMRRSGLELDFHLQPRRPHDIWGFFPYRDCRGGHAGSSVPGSSMACATMWTSWCGPAEAQ